MGKKPIVSVTYENESISIKKQLTLLKMCVSSFLCGPRTDLWPFYEFLWKQFSFYVKVYNGSKRLSPTPSVSNLSLRPCRYLSTVTRSSGRTLVDGFRRERLQRFATFDSLSVQRSLEAR